MKKLMIAAAIVCAAAFANAATVTWSATSIAEYGKTTAAASSLGYTAYLVDAALCSRDDMITALGNGDTSKIATAKIGDATTVGGMMAGMAMQSGIGSYPNDTTVNAYAVIFDGAIADAEHAFVTTASTGKTGSSGQAASFSFGALTGTQTASNWVNVPEPTSGLLLLLGVAGLALRRRRA